MSPQIRHMIAIRLSWLCKLGFLGKREKYIYMLRDVRKTHQRRQEEKLRDCLREESEHQEGHDSQESQGTNPKEAFSVLICSSVICWNRPYCMDPYRPYNNILKARKPRQDWAQFSRQPLKNFLKEDGRTEDKVQLHVVARISRCQLSIIPYNYMDCGTVFKTDLWGIDFVL